MPHTLQVQCSAIPLWRYEPALVPIRLEGREGINGLFEYELLLECPDAVDLRCLAFEYRHQDCRHGTRADLNAFIHQKIACRITVEGAVHDRSRRLAKDRYGYGAGARQIHAIVTSAVLGGAAGQSQRQVRLTLRPWLYLATLQTQCRIFQNQTVFEIFTELFRPYLRHFDWRCRRTEYAKRDFQTQYNESDFAFFERLCQEWGINYHFEHADGQHELVLVDHNDYFQKSASEAYHEVAFHAQGGHADAEHFNRLSIGRHLTSRAYSAGDYDYHRHWVPRVAHSIGYVGGAPGWGTVTTWHGGPNPTHFAQPDAGHTFTKPPPYELQQWGSLRVEALRTAHHRVEAGGNLRGMEAGRRFRLTGHASEAVNSQYIVLDTHFVLEDLSRRSCPDPSDTGESETGWRMRVELSAQPMAVPLRPEATRPKPFTHGPQSARVVGPPGKTVWTDEHGRIKVRFPWDPTDAEVWHTSCWIRVALPWAGEAMGAMFTPRVGHEVLIDFIGGDPDLPICIGSLHNGRNRTPWNMPGQCALNGLTSRELSDDRERTGRSSHLVFDDTWQQLQVQLKSDEQHSALSLGAIHRIEDRAGRKEARGKGMELRTDGHGAVRAAKGLLLSTHGRLRATGGIKDLQETRELLTRALAQLEAHAAGAVDLQAQDEGDQRHVAARLRTQNGSIAGASPQPLGELEAAHLVATSSAGAVLAAQDDLQLVAGAAIALASIGPTSLSVGGSLLASAARAVRLLAHRGMRLFAATGDLELQAQQDNLRASARQTAELQSTEGWVEIKAKQGIRLSVGGTCFEVTAAGITSVTEGQVTTYSAGQTAAGPRNKAMHLNTMPATGFDDRYRVVDADRKPLAGQAWSGRRMEGDLAGTSGGGGHIDYQASGSPDGWQVEIDNEPKP